MPPKIRLSCSIQMTDFRSSEFNDQKLTKALYSHQKDTPRKPITKTPAKQTFVFLSVHFICNWKGMQNSFSRNASTYFIELSDLYSVPQIKVYQIYSMFLDLFYWNIRNQYDRSFPPPSQNAMHK